MGVEDETVVKPQMVQKLYNNVVNLKLSIRQKCTQTSNGPRTIH